MPEHPDEVGSPAFAAGLQHAWNWFALHAGQRLQCLYFFILATSALVAVFGTALSSGKTGAALGIALGGAAVAVLFNLLDGRSKELVKAGEAAMREFEARIATETGIDAIRLVDRVETTRISRSASLSKAVKLFHGVAVVLWIGAAAVAWLRLFPG
jgi:hypothetical protein